jgi:DNA repair photolyase
MADLNSESLQFNRGSKVLPMPGLHVSPLSAEQPKFSGPVSREMWEKVSALNSSYPDNFDWGMYDRLYEKFGTEQPRGGVVFKTNFKLQNFHPQCSKCHYSFELDTYGRGCIHNCIYCYAKDQLTLRGYWNRPHPMPMDLSEVRKIFHTVFETNKNSKWRTILEQRVPVRIGSMSDPFMLMDQKYRVSYEFLRILRYYQYPYVVFTRSDLIAHDDYLAVIDPKIAAVQFSISGNNEPMTKLIEPGAPSIKRRLKALKALSDHGVWTAVRINPLFPTYPDGYFTDRTRLSERFSDGAMPRLPFFEIDRCDEFFDQLRDSKVPSVLAGFVRLNQTSISQLSKATNIDLRSFFKPENYTSSGESHYSDSEIAYHYKVLQDKTTKRGMRFSTCYIGNGMKDYFQYQELWNNKKDCCDIVGNVSGFKATAQNIDWAERALHAPSPEVARSVQKAESDHDAHFSENSTAENRDNSNKPGLKIQELKYTGLKWDRPIDA